MKIDENLVDQGKVVKLPLIIINKSSMNMLPPGFVDQFL